MELYKMRYFLIINSIVLLCLTPAIAQYAIFGEDIYIDNSRIVDWSNVGVETISASSEILVTDYPYGAYPNDGIDDTPAIMQAIQEAKTRVGITIIRFPAGTFLFESPIELITEKNVSGDVTFDGNIVFQGAGSWLTTLEFDLETSSLPCFRFQGLIAADEDRIPIITTIIKGSHQLNVNLSSIAENNDWIYFQEYNSNMTTDDHHVLGQVTQLQNAAAGTMADAASKAYPAANDLRVRRMWPLQNIGVENLRIERISGGHASGASNFVFRHAVNSWISGVESVETSEHHVNVEVSSHIEVRGCYFYEAHSHGSGGTGYGVALGQSTTNCLIHNNIFKNLRHSMLVQDGANCNVFSYNYSSDVISDLPEYAESDITIHGDFPYANLFESNSCRRIILDAAHGDNGPFNTFLRNITHYETTLHCFNSDYSNFISNDNINFIHDDIGILESLVLLFAQIFGITVDDIESSHHVLDVYSLLEEDDSEISHEFFYSNYWGLVDISYINDVSYYYSETTIPEYLDDYTLPAFGGAVKAPDGTIVWILEMKIPASDRSEEAIKTYNEDATVVVQTGGTLSYDQTWHNNITLSDIVVVPDDIALTIKQGASVNLNGFYIQCTGSGEIIIQNGVTFQPYNITMKSGSLTKGQYSTIIGALNNSFSGATIDVGSGTYTVDEHLTISSDLSIKFKSGCTLNFTGCFELNIYGNLFCSGTSGYPVIINGQNYTRTDYNNSMIDIKDGATANIQYTDFTNAAYDIIIRNSADVDITNSNFSNFGVNSNSKAVTIYYSTGDVSISDCFFDGSGQYGIGVYSTNTGTNVSISDNNFDDCRYGIRCYSSNAFLTDNVIEDYYYYAIQSDYVSISAEYSGNEIYGNFSSYSIYLNSSSPYLMFNDIVNSKVYINGGSPYFATRPGGPHNERGYNDIYSAGAPLIRVQNSATPYLGYGSFGGSNSIYETDLPHIYAINNSIVWADNNYWGEEGPTYQKDGSSYVLVRNPLAQKPERPLTKPMLAKNTYISPLLQDSNDDEKENLYIAAIETGFKSDYINAKENLLDLIYDEELSRFSILSIIMYDHFSQKEIIDENSPRDIITINQENDLLLNDMIKLGKEDERRPVALGLKVKNAGLSRQYSELSSYNNLITNEYPNTVYELVALYNEIGYQVEIINDYQKAKEILARMKTAFPDEELTLHARILMGENVELPKGKAFGDPEILSEDKSPTEYELQSASPNPFNPFTNISYSVPENTHVEITIYDIQGRLVKRLVNNFIEAGKYTVTWDGRNENESSVSSGLYIYVLRTSNKVISNKMLMIR